MEPGEREGLWESRVLRHFSFGEGKQGNALRWPRVPQGVTRSVNPGDKSIPGVVFLPLPQCGIWMVLSLESLSEQGKGLATAVKGPMAAAKTGVGTLPSAGHIPRGDCQSPGKGALERKEKGMGESLKCWGGSCCNWEWSCELGWWKARGQPGQDPHPSSLARRLEFRRRSFPGAWDPCPSHSPRSTPRGPRG